MIVAARWLGAVLLLWVMCPITDSYNAWGFAGGLYDWSGMWLCLTMGTVFIALGACMEKE